MTIEVGYYCKECSSPAMLIDGEIVRSCTHTGTVVAELEAHVTANGGVSDTPSPSNG
jgi:hypothetical protein